jgi:hypothetical protein
MNHLTGIMRFLAILTGLIMIFLIILMISHKIYTLIYTNYTLGLLFPYPNYGTIVFIVTIALILLVFIILRLIKKLKKYL